MTRSPRPPPPLSARARGRRTRRCLAAGRSSRPVSGQEGLGQARPDRGPSRAIEVVAGEGRVVGKPEALGKRREELRLERADGNVAAIRALVGVVERRPAIEEVDATRVLPAAPAAIRPWSMLVSETAPSTIAASTIWPRPLSRAWITAQRTPNARSMPPPPKSPSKFTGGTGRSPARPIAWSARVVAR